MGNLKLIPEQLSGKSLAIVTSATMFLNGRAITRICIYEKIHYSRDRVCGNLVAGLGSRRNRCRMDTKLKNDQLAGLASSPAKAPQLRSVLPLSLDSKPSPPSLISKLASWSFLHHLLPPILVRPKFGRNNKDFTN